MTFKTVKKIILFLILILLIATIFGIWKCTTKPAGQASVPPKVNVVKVDWYDINPEHSFVAKIESRDRVGLRARVTGFLQNRLFKEGDYVDQGQPLFIIEQVNFESALKEAQANYDRAAARAKNAHIQYSRTLKLYQTKDVSKARLDDDEAAFASANADLKQMTARLELAQKDLEYTVITAPMSGKIGEATFSVGELIGPQSGILANIVTVDPMDAVFSISENDLLNVRRQFLKPEDVEARFITADDYEYPQVGTLNFVDVTLDESMNTLKMKASLPNPDHKLISGQYGRIKLRSKKPTKMLVVPQKAIQRTADSEFVMIVKSDNTIEQRPVKTGMELPNYQMELLEGVKAGENVVVEGFQKISTGAAVTPVTE